MAKKGKMNMVLIKWVSNGVLRLNSVDNVVV